MRFISFIVSLAFFMEAVDSTAINTAIPAMAKSLNVYPVDLKIALISYLLSLAIFIPISGWLGDKYGTKKIFICALTIFTLSSFWCGFADNLKTLMIARFFQGMGGALGMPVGRLIILRTFERKSLILVMSRVVMVGALGMMLGPLLGGLITHYLSWHWIFWINIPVGIFAIIMATYLIPESELIDVPALDIIGFILFGSGLSALTFGLSSISETHANNSGALLIIISAIVLFILYGLHSRRQPYPIVNTKLFQVKTFQISVQGNLLSRLGFGGIPFLAPLLLQIGLGYSPQLSGLLIAPMALGVLLVKPLSLPLLRYFGYKRLLILNTLFAGWTIWLFMLIDKNTSIFTICVFTFIYGFVLSLQYSAMNSLAYADLSTNQLSSATSIMSTLQQISQSFGVAISALLIRFFSALAGINTLTPQILHSTFFVIGSITLLSIFIFIRLNPEDARQMT